MVLMRNGNSVKWVPDSCVHMYRDKGYLLDGVSTDESSNGYCADVSLDDSICSDRKFICPHCGKEYAKEAFLKKHMSEKHMA